MEENRAFMEEKRDFCFKMGKLYSVGCVGSADDCAYGIAHYNFFRLAMTLCFIFLTQNCTEYIYQIYLELTKFQKVETFWRKKRSIIMNGICLGNLPK